MHFLILFSLVALAAANYRNQYDATYTKKDGGYGGLYLNDQQETGYQQQGTGYPQQDTGYPQQDTGNSNHDSKKKTKLKKLDMDELEKAEVEYYKHKGNRYAVISCPPNPTRNKFTWILVESDRTVPPSGPSRTSTLAGGINVSVIAKLRNGKFQAENAFGQGNQRFKKVGCFHGDISTPVTEF